MSMIRYPLLFLILLFSVGLLAQEAEVPDSGFVKRKIAVAWEEDHPQVRLLAASVESELLNIDSIVFTENQADCDGILYIGRLEFGSRASLWVRGIDRFFDKEIFYRDLHFSEV